MNFKDIISEAKPKGKPKGKPDGKPTKKTSDNLKKCKDETKHFYDEGYNRVDESEFKTLDGNKWDKKYYWCEATKKNIYFKKFKGESEEKYVDGEICYLEGDKVWVYRKSGNMWQAKKQTGNTWYNISNRPEAVNKLNKGCKTSQSSSNEKVVGTPVVIEDPESRKKYWEDLIVTGRVYMQGLQHILPSKEVVYIVKVDKSGVKKPLIDLNNLELDNYNYWVLYPTTTNTGKMGKISINENTGKPEITFNDKWEWEMEEPTASLDESIKKILNKKLQEQKIISGDNSDEVSVKKTEPNKGGTKSIKSDPIIDILNMFGLNKENNIIDPKGILSGKTQDIQTLIDNGARSDWFYEWNQLLLNYKITPVLQVTTKDNSKVDITTTNEYLINAPLPDSDDYNQYNQKTFGGILKTKSNLPIYILRGREQYKSTESAKTDPASCKTALIAYLKDGLQKRSSVSEGNKCFICNCNSSGSFDEYKKMSGTKITIGGNESEFGITAGDKVSLSLSPYRWLFNKKLNWKEIVSIIRGESFKTTQGSESRIKSDFIISKFDDPNYDSCIKMGCSSNINESLIEKVKKRMVEAIIDKKILKENMVKSITKGLIK